VIGNPPYREFKSEFSAKESDETGAFTYDQYFVMRGVDLLKIGGLLVFVIPSTFMLNALKYNDFKEYLGQKADLIDAYRLPTSTFVNTEVQTDIIVLKRK
jgi:adenine-specific DNA methylase